MRARFDFLEAGRPFFEILQARGRRRHLGKPL